jgi:hypothetical protein
MFSEVAHLASALTHTQMPWYVLQVDAHTSHFVYHLKLLAHLYFLNPNKKEIEVLKSHWNAQF